jgi:hypothetical protein
MRKSIPGGIHFNQFELLTIGGGSGCTTAVDAMAHGGVRHLGTAIHRRGQARHHPLRELLHKRGIFLRGHRIPSGRKEALRLRAANEQCNLETELQREGRSS